MVILRRNNKSFIKKYIRLCMLVIFIGLMIFGSILLAFAKEYFNSEAERKLYYGAVTASRITTNNLIRTIDGYVPSNEVIAVFSVITNQFTGDEDGKILLTNKSGEIVRCSDEFLDAEVLSYCEHIDKIVDVSKVETSEDGYYFEITSLGDVFREKHYVVTVPIYNGYEEVIGYLINTSSMSSQTTFMKAVLQVFIIGAIAVAAFTFSAINILTDKMLSPLEEMSMATKSFAKGDFSQRVTVHNQGYDEVTQLAIAFNNMASSLAANEQTRRSFVANVSHELKTPMTTIGGFIDGILDGTIPQERHRQYLMIVSDEIKRLSRLVVSMLNLSRIEAGELEINAKEFDITQTVLQTLFTFERNIEDKHLEIRGLSDDKQIVVADEDMIHQVVYNLVDNAVKFANEGGYLEFSFTQKDGHIFVGVRNSGAGISKEEIKQVFDRFYKTDKSRSLDKNGVGLGLYIVKSIMNMHGGDIIATGVEGEYCEFMFTLPIPKGKPKSVIPKKKD